MERPYLTWTDLDWRLKCIPRIRSQEEAISPMFFTSYFWEWRIATKKFTNKSYRITLIRPLAWSTPACTNDKFACWGQAQIKVFQQLQSIKYQPDIHGWDVLKCGMVQANVGQSLVICDMLSVFFADQFLLFHATSCNSNALKKSMVLKLFCYINLPNQVLHHII